MAARPDIEILHVGTDENGDSSFAANCPEPECYWAEIIKGQENFSQLEELVYAHEQWHEDGMPD